MLIYVRLFTVCLNDMPCLYCASVEQKMRPDGTHRQLFFWNAYWRMLRPMALKTDSYTSEGELTAQLNILLSFFCYLFEVGGYPALA